MARTKKPGTGTRRESTVSKKRKSSTDLVLQGSDRGAVEAVQPIQSVRDMADERQNVAISKIHDDMTSLAKEMEELNAEIAASTEAFSSALAAAGYVSGKKDGKVAYFTVPGKSGGVGKLKAFVSSLFNRFPAQTV